MNSEHLLVLSLLKNKNIRSIINTFDPKEFKTEEAKRHYVFIKDFFKRHLSVPSVVTFEKEFGPLDFPEGIESEKFYAENIIEENNKEKLLMLLKSSSQKIVGTDSDVKNVVDFLTRHLKKINVGDVDVLSSNIGQDIEGRIERYHNKRDNKIQYYKWGFSNDNVPSQMDLECPLAPGRIYLIQARPGVGKTFLICGTAGKLALQGYKVLFISKEMDTEEVSERVDALISGTSYNRLKRGMLSDKELNSHIDFLKSIEGKIDLEIKNPRKCTQSTIQQFIEESTPDIVFIDYLQLLKDENKGTEKRNQIANIIYDCKEYAQHYKIPIVLISASNRASVDSDNGPGLENIAESDVVSFAVDVALSLYQTDEEKLTNTMNIRCVKNRHGKQISTKLMWDIDNSIIRETN